MRAESHGGLVKSCLTYLEMMGILAWKSQTAKVPLANGRYMATGRTGLPDITAIVPPIGRVLLIECKAGKDRVRPAQEAFMEVAALNGAACVVLRSVADLEPIITNMLGEYRVNL